MQGDALEEMVSVIVVAYNEEATIRRALDSVLMQECHLPVEIVVGEDCSTDGTRAICEEYARRFPSAVRLMEKAPNKGVIDNYYDCLLACRGKYIADCAGDDFWTDRLKLEKEVRIMEKDERVTIVHTDWNYYNEATGESFHGGVQEFASALTDGRDMLEAIITQTKRPVIHLCTALYRASAIRKAYFSRPEMFRNKAFRCEDLQICFAMAEMGVVAYIPECTLNYSHGGETVSSSASDTRQFAFVKGVTELSFYLSTTYNIRGRSVEKYFSKRLFDLLMHAFRSRSAALRDDALSCGRRWKARQTPLAWAARAVMSNAATWELVTCARKVFVWLKSSHA